MRSPHVDRLIRTALEEDIGPGDVTTAATGAPGTPARAELVAKEDFLLAGIGVARALATATQPRVSTHAPVAAACPHPPRPIS